MPRKTDNRTFIENQLRIFIASKKPTPATRLRAMHTLAAICGFLDIQFKDQEPEGGEHPETPTAVNENAAKVKAMLDQAAKNRQRGGIHANKLPESSSE